MKTMEKFFALKILSDFIVPTAIIVCAVTITLALYFAHIVRWSRKEKWLKNHGYKRYLLIPRRGNRSAIYEWKNKENQKRIREDVAEKMTYRKFVKKMQ